MSTDDALSPLLRRQLKRARIDLDAEPADPRWWDLLARVDQSYREADESRYLLERSIDLASREMQEQSALLASERDRLGAQLKVARDLQVSVLPGDHRAGWLEIAARMVSAEEVGGDYYDIIPTEDACWIGIGDVSGHGLRAAVLMTMAQSMAAALVRRSPAASPRDLLVALNEAMHENVTRRLGLDDFMTLSLLRCEKSGRVTFAGAHEDILVYRQARKTWESHETSGTWIGPRRSVDAAMVDQAFELGQGDLLVLYTDGLTEARDARGEQYGLERLSASLLGLPSESLAGRCERALAEARAWTSVQRDDMTLLLMRSGVTAP